MSEMVERVARAWADTQSSFVIYMHGSNMPVTVHLAIDDDPRVFGPSAMDEAEAWIAKKCARAAIEAMREPTQAQVTAANNTQHPPGARPLYEMVWRIMIDAALSDPEKPEP